jgi:DNA mismatch endonuclease Vsr
MHRRSPREQAPSFLNFRASRSTASRLMRKNRYGDTASELLLGPALGNAGTRYAVTNNDLPSKPDIAFSHDISAVCGDGDFWHGKPWSERQTTPNKGRMQAVRCRRSASIFAGQGQTIESFAAKDGWSARLGFGVS